jgi:hypothetical protein
MPNLLVEPTVTCINLIPRSVAMGIQLYHFYSIVSHIWVLSTDKNHEKMTHFGYDFIFMWTAINTEGQLCELFLAFPSVGGFSWCNGPQGIRFTCGDFNLKKHVKT